MINHFLSFTDIVLYKKGKIVTQIRPTKLRILTVTQEIHLHVTSLSTVSSFIADDTPESMSSVHNDHEYGKKAYIGKKQKHGQYLAIRANNQFESQREIESSTERFMDGRTVKARQEVAQRQ